MRILALTNLYPNPLQPVRGTFNRQQLRALAERHDVRVIAPISWTDEWSLRRKGAAPLPPDRRVTLDGINVSHPKYWFPPKVLRSRYGHYMRRSVAAAFSNVLREFRPDLVFSAWAYPDGWAAVELAREAGLPVVVKVHGSDILTLVNTPGRRRRTAEVLKRADAVIAVSQDLADKVIQMGAAPNAVTVVYDGIDSKLFCPGSKEEARSRLQLPREGPIILFVGNLVPVKGTKVLVDACRQLLARNVPFRCYIVGQGPLRDALQRQITDGGLADRVKLVGAVRHELLPDWFRAADVFVLPSFSEGVPCVLLEAAGCRTPFVASRVGGIPEIADLNVGTMITPGRAGELAEAIVGLLGEDSRRRLKEPYRRSHADGARDIEAVCEQVLSKSGKPQGVIAGLAR